MRVGHPKSIVNVAFYKPASFRRSVMTAVLVACYAIVLYFVYDIMGNPHRAALVELEIIKEKYPEKYGAASIKKAKAKKKASKFGAIMHDRQSLFDDEEDEFDEIEGFDELAEEADTPEEPATTVGEDVTEDAADNSNSSKTNTTDYEDLPPMPPWYLPNAFCAASLFLLMSSHALFHLLCHWMVWFKAKALFDPLTSVDDIRPGSTYAMVIPQPHRGKAAMACIERLKYTDRLAFTFQKQVYLYERPEDGADNGRVILATPPQLTVGEHLQSTGLSDAGVIQTRGELFGKNSLMLATPSFMMLYKQQLTSPIAMFQFFTSILWLMDEYWQYTLFSLFNVLTFESTTTFQRLKTMKTLNSMSSKPYLVFVFRYGRWSQMSTAELLPGDLLSLKRATGKASVGGKQAMPIGATDVIPCDCVLLNGSAVVNEATLTGESVPQMKEALKPTSDPATKLEMDRQHRVNVLFSGTSLISSRRDESASKVPPTPDGGCLAMALRTGFNSSQGELVQMIEFSQQKVSGDSKETLMALGILLVFALVAAGYVLKKGIEKGDRTTHQLLLKSVIIITSVVPQQLPMQMAMAVNTALLNLTRSGIFCTEPYRVPYAGKVDHCLFDKTGTLTTDKLVPVGVVSVQPRSGETRMLKGSQRVKVTAVSRNACEVQLEDGNKLKVESVASLHPVQSREGLLEVNKASEAAALVLAGCHSLVDVEGVGLIGDPIELAGLQGVQWHYDARKQLAQPDFGKRAAERAFRANKAILEDTQSSKSPKEKEDAKTQNTKLSAVMLSATRKIKRSAVESVRIHQRHHFASKLQRMSVVCNVSAPRSPHLHGQCCLVKGSPEAVGALLRANSRPQWYETMYTRLAELGMRVLALAYKQSRDRDATKLSREWVESELDFAGFIAFECKTRADSGMVIRALVDSNHQVTMVTGDAPLTANYVAQQVCISSKKSSLLLRVEGDATGEAKGERVAFWEPAEQSTREVMPARTEFDVSQVRALADDHDLIVTEDGLEVMTALSGGEMMKHVDCIRVFSRMSPHGKATVIRALQKHQGLHLLMCGDGGNDVGALKQAEVGLALLSGYGDSNTDAVDDQDGNDGKGAEDKLNEKVENLKKKGARARLLMSQEFAAKKKELSAKQAEWIKEDMQKNNLSGVWATVQATTRAAKRMTVEMRNEQQRLSKKYNVYASKDSKKADDPMESAMDSMVPVVRPGDASVAAPFTTRIPSVKSVVDLIRQGRCTLLSALQQQQIMMLQCMISAYTLSALNLNGARSSERQMMASGWLIMIASIAFSYSKPVDKMHPVRPLKSLFHPAIIISIACQAVIHLYAMITAVNMAKEVMGEKLLQEVIDFHRKNDRAAAAAALEYEEAEVVEDEDPMAEFWSMWSTPFKPNLMNTVVFLVETSQIIAVLFVNYKGRPWMKGVTENHPLFLSVFFCVLGVAICAWGIFPEVNAAVHLEPFPDDDFRWKVMGLVSLSMVGTFIVDRVVTALFAPHIFKIMLQQARATKVSDIWPAVVTFAKVCGVIALLALGNVLVWGLLAYWWWRRRKKAQADLLASTD